METNNFYNNGLFNDETMGLIKNGVYLAKKAYDNKDKLDNLSKPLNNIDTKNLTPKKPRNSRISKTCGIVRLDRTISIKNCIFTFLGSKKLSNSRIP